jgi:outer membrane receptor for ferrienterochelin and colicins
MNKYFLALLFFLSSGVFVVSFAQFSLSIRVVDAASDEVIPGAVVYVAGKSLLTDFDGMARKNALTKGKYTYKVTYVSMQTLEGDVEVSSDTLVELKLKAGFRQMDELVVSGTLKPISKSESAVPIEVLSATFFKKNPSPRIFDALHNVNGVRPQINCNICSTGDIHINGLEGPYTLVLIDGMPIVSALGSVYGLSGIPMGIVDKIEIMKGPSSTLYGSEAMGGLINIITKKAEKAPRLYLESNTTSWFDTNLDAAISYSKNNVGVLLGANLFNYNKPKDLNIDGFTDLTLQQRASFFSKVSFGRTHKTQVALRYLNENRWGGQLGWQLSDRGKETKYGESIFTKRFEFIANQDLGNDLSLDLSYTHHNQDSFYGTTKFLGDDKIVYFLAKKYFKIKLHEVLVGTPLRLNLYDDNTFITESNNQNKPVFMSTPGVFVQDQWRVSDGFTALTGIRFDYNSVHGAIWSPRLALKFKDDKQTVRLNIGRGYRVVNLFSEDHAALSGARKVIVKETLKSEQSWNVNLNFDKQFVFSRGFVGFDASVFYTHFFNQIIPNYDVNPTEIIYANLKGYAYSRGFSLNLDLATDSRFTANVGVTFLDSKISDGKQKVRPVLSERVNGVWNLSYVIGEKGLKIDYTGNLVGPMRLPTQNELDPRPKFSPTWSVQNLQLSKPFISDKLEVFGGVKNVFNFLPYKNLPFLIARSEDPFNKNVTYNDEGGVVVNSENPYGLNFDPSYVFASLQGRRMFLGFRLKL